jgi:hypothetical protein
MNLTAYLKWLWRSFLDSFGPHPSWQYLAAMDREAIRVRQEQSK